MQCSYSVLPVSMLLAHAGICKACHRLCSAVRAYIGLCGPWCLPWHAIERSVKCLLTRSPLERWAHAEPSQSAGVH